MKILFYKRLTRNPEIGNTIPPSAFCPTSGYWGMLEIPNLALISLMKCYRVLQNARVIAFTVSELLRENQRGAGKTTPSPLAPPRLGL